MVKHIVLFWLSLISMLIHLRSNRAVLSCELLVSGDSAPVCTSLETSHCCSSQVNYSCSLNWNGLEWTSVKVDVDMSMAGPLDKPRTRTGNHHINHAEAWEEAGFTTQQEVLYHTLTVNLLWNEVWSSLPQNIQPRVSNAVWYGKESWLSHPHWFSLVGWRWSTLWNTATILWHWAVALIRTREESASVLLLVTCEFLAQQRVAPLCS